MRADRPVAAPLLLVALRELGQVVLEPLVHAEEVLRERVERGELGEERARLVPAHPLGHREAVALVERVDAVVPVALGLGEARPQLPGERRAAVALQRAAHLAARPLEVALIEGDLGGGHGPLEEGAVPRRMRDPAGRERDGQRGGCERAGGQHGAGV